MSANGKTNSSSTTPANKQLMVLNDSGRIYPSQGDQTLTLQPFTPGPNINMTQEDQESYDYYMEAHNQHNHPPPNNSQNHRSVPTEGNQGNSYPGNGSTNDTFEDLWRDEMDDDYTEEDGEEDVGGSSVGTDEDSRISLQRRWNWKAAMAQQQQQQQQQAVANNLRTNNMASPPLVDSTNSKHKILPTTPGTNLHKPPKQPSNSSSTTPSTPFAGGPQQPWFSPSPPPGSGLTQDTNHTPHGPLPRNGGTALDQSERTISLSSEPAPPPSSMRNPSPPTPQRILPSPGAQSSSETRSLHSLLSDAEHSSVYPASLSKQRPPLSQPPRTDHNHTSPPQPTADSQRLQNWKQQYQVLKRSQSSPPPDPPSHLVLPKQQDRVQPRIFTTPPPSPPSRSTPVQDHHQDYYDPEDEQDALTNLVITVVGLDGEDDTGTANEDEQSYTNRRRGRTQVTHLLPPGHPEQEEASGGARRSFRPQPPPLGATGSMTLFWTADATSGLFFASGLLLLVPLASFGLLLWDALDTTTTTSFWPEQWRSWLRIPMNEDVSHPVRAAQLLFLLGWVLLVKQTALVATTFQCLAVTTRRRRRRNSGSNHNDDDDDDDDDYANGSGVLPTTTPPDARPTMISKCRWMTGTFLEWCKHALYMVTAVLVLVQATDSVLALIWNMAALEFVSRLDALALNVWTTTMGSHHQGWWWVHPEPNMGAPTDATSAAKQRQESRGIQSTVPFPNQPPTQQPWLRILLYFFITSAILLAFGVVVYEQVLGHPPVQECRAIAIQFGEIQTSSGAPFSYYASLFGGIYVRRQGQFVRHHGRYIYDLATAPLPIVLVEETAQIKLAYCRPLQAWTLSQGTRDPCQAYLLRTASTKTYDVFSLQADSWLVASGSSTADRQLDWFQVACVDCTHPNDDSEEEEYGYHCIDGHDIIQEYHEEATALHAPVQSLGVCANLTWDTRRDPFPDVFWELSSLDGASDTAPIQYYDDESATIAAGVDTLAPFEVIVDANGSVLLEPQFQRPVYSSHFNSQLVLLAFLGRRWVIVLMRTPQDTISQWRAHPERHMERLHALWAFFWEQQLLDKSNDDNGASTNSIVPMYLSDPVDMSTRENTQAAPIGLKWNLLQHEHGSYSSGLSLFVARAPFDTVLYCAVCDEDSNPCHSGGICHLYGPDRNAGGRCICRSGFDGFLCESFAPRCQGGGAASECLHNGSCNSDGTCDCPMWERNNQAFPVRGDVCEYLPNCWDFESDGMECFEKGTCSNVGCENGGFCTLDGTCDCEGLARSKSTDAGRYRGKLCHEQVNCYDYESDGSDCIEKGMCSNSACNGGTCTRDGSCSDCPALAIGRFCQVVPDCFEFETDGAHSDCFGLGRCTNLGCVNGGVCQKDGSCRCRSSEDPNHPAEEESKDPFDDDQYDAADDDSLALLPESDKGLWFTGKLCQIPNREVSGFQDPDKPPADESGYPDDGCSASSCVTNGGSCNEEGSCVCPDGQSGNQCEIVADCYEADIDGFDCFDLGTCTSKACHSRSSNSTCLPDGQCECEEMNGQELYGKLCNKERPIDDCFEAESDGRDCFKLGTCSNEGCDNGGACTPDGNCDCPPLFWGKRCQHAKDCFQQEYNCFFTTFLTSSGEPVPNIDPSTTPCSDAGCLNNGICQASGICSCPEGYAGKVCQEVIP